VTVLLVDDLLTAPVKGLIWVFEEIHKAASEEQRARRDDIMAALSALYRALEQGELTDEAFDSREQALLDELDALDAREAAENLEEDEIAGVPVEELLASALKVPLVPNAKLSDAPVRATSEAPSPTEKDELTT
jgi:hypothetical protein